MEIGHSGMSSENVKFRQQDNMGRIMKFNFQCYFTASTFSMAMVETIRICTPGM